MSRRMLEAHEARRKPGPRPRCPRCETWLLWNGRRHDDPPEIARRRGVCPKCRKSWTVSESGALL